MLGKLIVIEGIDGSGKTTQKDLLVERFKRLGKEVETIHFPRHGQKFFGLMVDQYLNNEFGDAAKLDPRITTLLFAGDRWEAKEQLDQWLNQGKIVILDRYTTSIMGHQLAKIEDNKRKDDFLKWLEDLEFETYKLPRPDLVVYLSVDIEIIYELMKSRSSHDKEYINGSHDGLERDSEHLKKAKAAYEYSLSKYPYWRKIDCTVDGKLLTIEEVHGRVWKEVVSLLDD